jgi:hypothetical protein
VPSLGKTSWHEHSLATTMPAVMSSIVDTTLTWLGHSSDIVQQCSDATSWHNSCPERLHSHSHTVTPETWESVELNLFWGISSYDHSLSSELAIHCQNSCNRQPTIAIQTVNNTRQSMLMFWHHYNFSLAGPH